MVRTFLADFDGKKIKKALRHSITPIPVCSLHVVMNDLASISTIDLQIALKGISVPSRSSQATFSNWAKTFECRPKRVFLPSSPRECQMIVELARREGAMLHPVGVGHSPSDLACTNGWLVRMEGLEGLVEVGSGGQRNEYSTDYDRSWTTRRLLRPSWLEPLCIRYTPPSPAPIHLSQCRISGVSRIKPLAD